MKRKLSLGKELSKVEMKQITGGLVGYTQTYCSGGPSGPFPTSGSTNIGCQPGYCAATGHGSFLYCA
jgi:hypothetical protein